ncbi:MAG: TM2 domain-containing protein [Prevotella sp.]|nr:TM2 domain-containing protein [Alistipes senegalensis]MCM1357365.1 TM2 domain-containing protein [Prevotella sp.]MCM1472988.1 TM2 domain-containing protein [Muribaculaceae bacterium]
MKCPYCGAETRYAKCEFCDSVIEQSAGETVNEIFQDVTRNVTQNIVQNITINPDTTITDISKKSKSTAIALCCLGFVGLGGIHRFYAGKIGTGLIWLCTAGCFGIGTVIDLVSIIINKFDDNKEKRISKW